MKRGLVVFLEWLCDHMHWLTWHRPWLWLPLPNVHCFFSYLSATLDERWDTGVWTAP